MINMKKGQIKRNELDVALKELKKDKAPGPDIATKELVKWLDHENREHLLGVMTICWNQECFPDEALAANVASIFKTGGTKKLGNDRPTYLLNTF